MFLLSSQNVFEYLIHNCLCAQQDKDLNQIELKAAKNFNLLLGLQTGQRLLVKQERYNSEGKTAGEFVHEWRIQEFLQRFSELDSIRPLLPEILHFNAEDSIIVFRYLDDYSDLADFYTKQSRENEFPTAIATALGTALATIHRITFDCQDYRDFFTGFPDSSAQQQASALMQGLDRLTPEIFGSVPADGLKFFILYQRYDSLGQAIAELSHSFDACCLAHNDLKLNNVLLHLNWEKMILPTDFLTANLVRLIDWERCSWGDPAMDLGMLVASYLQFWLGSLVVSKTISIEESLRLAMIPLEKLQPSIVALTQVYLQRFPEILERHPDFLRRVVQFAGLALIHQIQAVLQHQKAFGNAGICTLQVAKSLLCRPAQSIPTVFGQSEAELIICHSNGFSLP